MAEMQSVANVAGGLVSLSDLEAEGERQRDRQLDVVSRLEELAEIGWREEASEGSARFAGWDRIPSERGGEAAERRRRREVVVVSTRDEIMDDEDDGFGEGLGGAGWRAMG